MLELTRNNINAASVMNPLISNLIDLPEIIKNKKQRILEIFQKHSGITENSDLRIFDYIGHFQDLSKCSK